MNRSSLMGSESLSRLAALPTFSEYSGALASELSASGAFLGAMEKSGMPFFLDPARHVIQLRAEAPVCRARRHEKR